MGLRFVESGLPPLDASEHIKWADSLLEQYEDRRSDDRLEVTLQGETLHLADVRWYTVNPIKEAVPGHDSRKVLFYAPHVDDAELAAGVALGYHIDWGDQVDVLHFTTGSGGRNSRGFDGKNLPKVRLAEGIKAAETLGTHRVGTIVTPHGHLGFPEWFWRGDTPEMRALAIALIREYNPHVIYSPHDDPDVDSHPDHQASAALAKMGISWGTEGAFYVPDIPGVADNFQDWYRYAIWEGTKTLPKNSFAAYDGNGPYAIRKLNAAAACRSQNGYYYGCSMLGRDEYVGGMRDVGDDRHRFMEPFDRFGGPKNIDEPPVR